MLAKTEFDTHYAFLLSRVLQMNPEYNRRTDKRIKAVDGAFFRLSTFPILNLRDMNPYWTCAEAVWFMAGKSDARFMRELGFKNWDAFTDKDGFTVRSATGYRWRKHFNVDQLQMALEKLTKDRSNRQALMLSWDPWDDSSPGPNVPCVFAWHVHILNDELHMSVSQRSGDLYFGVPHDLLGARLVQELMAAHLEVGVGNISYMVSNAHLYQDQWEAAVEMVSREDRCLLKAEYPRNLSLTPKHAKAAMQGDIWVVKELLDKVMKFYEPFPAIKGPRLVK